METKYKILIAVAVCAAAETFGILYWSEFTVLPSYHPESYDVKLNNSNKLEHTFSTKSVNRPNTMISATVSAAVVVTLLTTIAPDNSATLLTNSPAAQVAAGNISIAAVGKDAVSGSSAKAAETTSTLTTTTIASTTTASLEIGTNSVGIIAYLGSAGSDDKYVREFTLLLYASWRFVTTHTHLATEAKIRNWKPLARLNLVDLIVFCAKKTCPKIPQDCAHLTDKNPPFNGPDGKPKARCLYAIQEEHPFAISNYGYINSFAMANHPHFDAIISRYTYVFRVDTDTFVTPGFLIWLPDPAEHEISFVTASAYNSPSTRDHLAYIASHINLTYQGVHSVAPSFYMRPSIARKLLLLCANVTESIYTDHMIGNKSVAWYHTICSLYATELAMNHLIANMSQHRVEIKIYDGSAGSPGLLEEVIQSHCYHLDPYFEKFQFYEALKTHQKQGTLDPRMLMLYGDLQSTQGMTVYEYSTYIAWNGAGHYENWFSQKIEASIRTAARLESQKNLLGKTAF